MLTTTNYSVLKSLDDKEDIIIKPNTPFKPFEGNYKVLSALQVQDVDTKKYIAILNAGEEITGIGTVVKAPVKKVVKKVVDLLGNTDG